jgi:hypothetical protein
VAGIVSFLAGAANVGFRRLLFNFFPPAWGSDRQLVVLFVNSGQISFHCGILSYKTVKYRRPGTLFFQTMNGD